MKKKILLWVIALVLLTINLNSFALDFTSNSPPTQKVLAQTDPSSSQTPSAVNETSTTNNETTQSAQEEPDLVTQAKEEPKSTTFNLGIYLTNSSGSYYNYKNQSTNDAGIVETAPTFPSPNYYYSPTNKGFVGWGTRDSEGSFTPVSFPLTLSGDTDIYAIYEDIITDTDISVTYNESKSDATVVFTVTVNPNITGLTLNSKWIKNENGTYSYSVIRSSNGNINGQILYYINGNYAGQILIPYEVTGVIVPIYNFSYVNEKGETIGTFTAGKNSTGWTDNLPTSLDTLTPGYNLHGWYHTMFGGKQLVQSNTAATVNNSVFYPALTYDITFIMPDRDSMVTTTYFHSPMGLNYLGSTSIPKPVESGNIYIWQDQDGNTYTTEELSTTEFSSPKTLTAVLSPIEEESVDIPTLELKKTYDGTPLEVDVEMINDYVTKNNPGATIENINISSPTTSMTEVANITTPNTQVKNSSDLGTTIVEYTADINGETKSGKAEIMILPQVISVSAVATHINVEGDDTLFNLQTSSYRHGFNISYVASIPANAPGASSVIREWTSKNYGKNVYNQDPTSLLGGATATLYYQEGANVINLAPGSYSALDTLEVRIENIENHANFYRIDGWSTNYYVYDVPDTSGSMPYNSETHTIHSSHSAFDIVRKQYGSGFYIKFWNEETMTFDKDEVTTAKDVGVYEFRFKVFTDSSSNEAKKSIEAASLFTYEITQIEATVSASPASKQEGQNDPEFMANVSSGVVFQDDAVDISASRNNKDEAVGVYENVIEPIASGDDADNYTFNYVPANFVIEQGVTPPPQTQAPPPTTQAPQTTESSTEAPTTTSQTSTQTTTQSNTNENTQTTTQANVQTPPTLPATLSPDPQSAAAAASPAVFALAAVVPTIEVGQEPIPLAGVMSTNQENGGWSLLDLILTIITGTICVIMLLGFVNRKNRNGNDEDHIKDERNDKYSKPSKLRLLTIVPTIVSIVVFILTQDLDLPMVWADKWTIVFAITALVQCGLIIFSVNDNESDNENNHEKT